MRTLLTDPETGRFMRKPCGCCGQVFGRAGETPRGLWSPYFCEPCDGQRVRRVSLQIHALAERKPAPTGVECDHKTVLTRAEVIGAAEREKEES